MSFSFPHWDRPEIRFSLESVAHNPVLGERRVKESDEKLCVPIISTSPKTWNKKYPPKSFMVPGKIQNSKFVCLSIYLFFRKGSDLESLKIININNKKHHHPSPTSNYEVLPACTYDLQTDSRNSRAQSLLAKRRQDIKKKISKF